MTTPNDPSSVDYQLLLSEIQSTIDKNDSLFKQIQKSNYPDAGTYSSDLLNYKIDKQVTDLTATRTQIWDFLTKKYNENTNLRAYYFDEIRKADDHIADITGQKNDIIDLIQAKQVMSSTADESIKQQKFYFNKMEYYLDQLNGTWVNIRGNHCANNGVKSIGDFLITPIGPYTAFVSHYPIENINMFSPELINFVLKRTDFQLNGHIHSAWKYKYYQHANGKYLMYNVGIDVHNYFPISDSDIIGNISKIIKMP